MGESLPRSVLTTSIKILPYRPPARLIRAKYVKKIKINGGLFSVWFPF